MNSAWFIFLIISNFTLIMSQDKLGDDCKVKEYYNISGKCEELDRCKYASDRFYKMKKHPTAGFQRVTAIKGLNYPVIPHGSTDNVTTIHDAYCSKKPVVVCCPINIHETGELGFLFRNTPEGKLAAGNYECIYNGKYPLGCCKGSRLVDVDSRISESSNCREKLTLRACNACYKYAQKKKTIICNQESSLKISGGLETTIQEFPHMALIGFRNFDDSPNLINWHGAGTLISDKWVLTAAHVIMGVPSDDIWVMLGATNKSDVKTGVLRNVQKRIPYRHYNAQKVLHDIGLLKLGMEVDFNEKLQPACLPVQELFGAYFPKSGRISGWGRRNPNNVDRPAILNMAAIDLSLCERDTFIWRGSDFICLRPNSADTCQGDSGGALVAAIVNNTICGYYVLGVVSNGDLCGNSNSYYANVRKRDYMTWIMDHVWPKDS